ncbi:MULTISPECIES: HpcH/HpaI aldolase/citrate lyase family protein [unclassified Beijerinckia]|uniref:aldolase/citrate lyase family protein n=1 Tax=unclassified Beijerinckia TaxID=2638183 RepID=UPI00089671F1|nr:MULTISPECIES: HpcH/HpaI aldolase/citrate lyase family protein [unclassified Beijerinckia]MDH7794385.1 4-hydroxy-2-oxoheptanedioate aldolase [Beijerinckia sp. GAS462]SEB60628.1 2,4-dihydroxyhept-2-enedioate aldolase [Beijerinckia sp. 28-YEA-48]
MPSMTNTFKAAIKAKKPQIGLWQSLASPYTTELCAGAGFDFLVIDGEHAPNDIPSIMAQLQAMKGSSSHAIVRPPVGETSLIKQVLDIGAQTILVPIVETVEQAQQLVAAVRYPPLGVRGVAGLTRATQFGKATSYLQRANDEVCLLVQVETRKGLDNLNEIAAVDGVDGVFIGPADLSAALGHLGNMSHPEVRATIEDCMKRIAAAGKAPGILMADEVFAQRCLDLGALFVAVNTDITLFAQSVYATATKYKRG